MLIRKAQLLSNQLCDLRLENTFISQIAEHLTPRPDEVMIDAHGHLLLPGLQDHHIHLFSLAAALSSLQCGPPHITNEAGLIALLQNHAHGTGWLRGIGYHDSVAGEIDQAFLDRYIPNRPIRIQHRSGRLWILNSAALKLLNADIPFGHLYDQDQWLRENLTQHSPDLTQVSRYLASFGITGITDTSAHNDPAQYALFAAAQAQGQLLQDVTLMGQPSLTNLPTSPALQIGAVKFHLHEHDLPNPQDLTTAFRAAHQSGRAIAVHCVTLSDLALTLDCLEQAGAYAGDRIEHASICPPDFYLRIKQLGLTIITQPNFITERGDIYRRDVDNMEQVWLYPCSSLMEAGIGVAFGTDAPFGHADCWAAMHSATTRQTQSGHVIGKEECISPDTALQFFLTPRDTPSGAARKIEIGAQADLCLLDRTWEKARLNLSAVKISHTWKSGQLIWSSRSSSIQQRIHQPPGQSSVRRNAPCR